MGRPRAESQIEVLRMMDDPLSRALAPPPDETPQARAARLQAEARAQAISDAIDSQLRAEMSALKRKKKPVKVLLLGQSESGKSTTLKSACLFLSALSAPFFFYQHLLSCLGPSEAMIRGCRGMFRRVREVVGETVHLLNCHWRPQQEAGGRPSLRVITCAS